MIIEPKQKTKQKRMPATALSLPEPSERKRSLARVFPVTESNRTQTAAEVREYLRSLGVRLRQDWIAHCLGQGDAPEGLQEAKEAVYRIFLSCDLREAGEACLPAGVGSLAKECIRDKVVVQVSIV